MKPVCRVYQAFIPGINKVGDLFGRGQLFLPELMVAADAMQAATDVINAALAEQGGQQKNLEQALKSAGLRDRFKTMVGGAPVTGRWAARIGADAYAEDAQDGVVKIKELLAGK